MPEQRHLLFIVMVNLIVVILGIVFVIVGFGIMTCASSPDVKSELKGSTGYILGAFVAVFGCALIYSPIKVVYSWFGFDESVISIEHGKAVPHVFAYWRRPNVYSIPPDGIIHGEKEFSCNAIYENRFGSATLSIDAKVANIPSFLEAFPQTSRLLVGSDVMEVISPSAWPCLKAWVKAGMPDGQEQDAFIHKYFDAFAEKGIKVNASFSFDSSVSFKKASSD